MTFSHLKTAAFVLAGGALLGQGLSAAPADCMVQDPQFWLASDSQRELRDKLMEYFVCPESNVDGPYADQIACNYLVGKVIQDLHGHDDFKTENGWMTANQIAREVADSDEWSDLGKADTQDALNNAARLASDGNVVIAVRPGTPGHVALILPGATRYSGSWKLRVPNSAAFSLNRVENAYAFCRLSYAFSSNAGVLLFARE